MDVEQVQARLAALFGRRREPGGFARLWGLSQEPADVSAEALATLYRALRKTEHDRVTLREQLLAARHELEHNLSIVESLAASRENPPFAYVTWLWRVAESLRRVETELTGAANRTEPKAPVVPRFQALDEPAAPLPGGPALPGFAVSPLLDLAQRETRVLGRRRRLLEAVRRALLEGAAGLPVSAAQVEPRILAVTEAIQQITEWQQAGVDAEEDLAYQLRRAVHARDPRTVDALLEVMTELGRASDTEHGAVTRLRALRNGTGWRVSRRAPTLEEASERAFGSAAAQKVRESAARAQRELDAAPSTAFELVQAANSVDASFELGRSVTPVRAIEEQRRMAVVPFPTQTLVLEPARGVADLPNSLIGDPRLVVHQLATRSLLARRYLAERKQRRGVVKRCSEARYYLLDGSASMSGRRGRMRDAILISELSMLIRHLEIGNAAARPVIYYRYFSKHTEDAIKVSSSDEALAAIEAVMVRRSRGETDIQAALIDSFHQIAKERANDPTLERAQIVLVTDGIAQVELWPIWRAREALQGVPVRVSVIALGAESPALKELAATERARGEPVFYHYLSDQAIAEMLRRTRIARAPLGAAPSPVAKATATATTVSVPGADEALDIPIAVELPVWLELDQLVDELSVLRAPVDVDRIEDADPLVRAYEELGVSLAEQGFEAERARLDALRRDARAVTLRFERWFPDPDRLSKSSTPPPAELVELLDILIGSVAELVDYLGGSPVQRQVDAIELLERLLLEAGISPWAYTHALPHVGQASRDALSSLRRGIS
jgi:hypothetical protein